MLLELPEEIILQIVAFLTFRARNALAATCTSARRIARDGQMEWSTIRALCCIAPDSAGRYAGCALMQAAIESRRPEIAHAIRDIYYVVPDLPCRLAAIRSELRLKYPAARWSLSKQMTKQFVRESFAPISASNLYMLSIRTLYRMAAKGIGSAEQMLLEAGYTYVMRNISMHQLRETRALKQKLIRAVEADDITSMSELLPSYHPQRPDVIQEMGTRKYAILKYIPRSTTQCLNHLLKRAKSSAMRRAIMAGANSALDRDGLFRAMEFAEKYIDHPRPWTMQGRLYLGDQNILYAFMIIGRIDALLPRKWITNEDYADETMIWLFCRATKMKLRNAVDHLQSLSYWSWSKFVQLMPRVIRIDKNIEHFNLSQDTLFNLALRNASDMVTFVSLVRRLEVLALRQLANASAALSDEAHRYVRALILRRE